MKITHTPLDVATSNKKPIFGLAALAVAGGITSSLIFNTHAYEEPLYGAPSTVYAVVGPDYFIESGLEDYLDNDGITNVYVANTDIADFYGKTELPKKEVEKIYAKKSVDEGENTGEETEKTEEVAEEEVKEEVVEETPVNNDEPKPEIKPAKKRYIEPADEYYCDTTAFACLQGYEAGETEIVVEYENGNKDYITLKSVELEPNSTMFEKLGGTITGTGSLKGASNDLLRLVGISGSYNIDYDITGDRSWSITTYEDSEYVGASLIWEINGQLVGGGTEINFIPVYGVDEMSDDDENKEILEDAFISLIRTLISSTPRKRDIVGPYITTEDSIVASLDGNLSGGPNSYYKVSLSADNNSHILDMMPDKIRESFESSLPEDVTGLIGSRVRAEIEVCEAKSNAVSRGTSANDTCESIGEFMSLSQNLKYTFDVSDEDEVEEGYIRKYYATVYDYESEKTNTFRSIEAEYDAENQTVTVNGPVGIYGYGYVDELKPVEEKEEDAPLAPNTGSTEQKATSALTISFLPFIIAAIAGAVIARKKSIHKLAKRFNHFN